MLDQCQMTDQKFMDKKVKCLKLQTFARFGQYEYDGDNSNMGRLHAQYSF